MKRLFFFSLIMLAFPFPVMAQVPLPSLVEAKEGEITSKPVCGILTNRSPISMRGSLSTMPQTLKDGTQARHMINFKLAPNEKREICASGPFYKGTRLELTIRTLIPLFSCKTKINGVIYLDMREDFDGVKQYSATCY